MKREIKKNITISFKGAKIEVEDGNIIVREFDKDGYIINEIQLLDAIGCLVGEEGLDISFKKSSTLDE